MVRIAAIYAEGLAMGDRREKMPELRNCLLYAFDAVIFATWAAVLLSRFFGPEK
jgi:hypothetical protein